MVIKQNLPKWVTLDRKNYLVELWNEYGNRCLYGHRTCPIPSHYAYIEHKGVKIAIPITVACLDSAGNPLKKEGKQIYLTTYTEKTISVKVKKIARLYDLKSEVAIKNWKQTDRQDLIALWQLERKRLHSTGERTQPARGRFSAISKDIYAEAQPLYYLDGQGISGLTFKPFVRVRIASSYIRLYVDLGDIFREVSKSKRRKAIRYGKPLPMSIKKQISQKVFLAVKDYHTN